MSNSPLVTHVNLSPNKTSPRNHAIDTITIHCVVGQVNAKRGCELFQSTARQASCNYVVGCDGSIGLCVEEKDRSWCSGGTLTVNGISGKMNDHRAVTIEVACDAFHPYAVTPAAYEALIRLVADIAKRNGMGRLLWGADKALVGKPDQQNLTVHRWFARKACPGDWLYERHGEIAQRANEINYPTKEEEKMTELEIRAIVADEFKRQLDNAASPVYNTLDEVPEWARAEIQEAVDLGILKGTGDGLGLTPQKLEATLLSLRSAKAVTGKEAEG